MSRAIGWLILAGLVLLGLFAALNWETLTAPTSLRFLGASLQAPLGLILLAVAVAFALLALAHAAALRTVMLIKARRHAQALEEQRRLADEAEASRLRELRVQLEQEFGATRRAIEESANGLAAALGQIDDKLNGRP